MLLFLRDMLREGEELDEEEKKDDEKDDEEEDKEEEEEEGENHRHLSDKQKRRADYTTGFRLILFHPPQTHTPSRKFKMSTGYPVDIRGRHGRAATYHAPPATAEGEGESGGSDRCFSETLGLMP